MSDGLSPEAVAALAAAAGVPMWPGDAEAVAGILGGVLADVRTADEFPIHSNSLLMRLECHS